MFCETFYLQSKALIQTEEEEGQISLETFSFYKFYGVISQFIMQFLKAVTFFFSLFVSVPKTLALVRDRMGLFNLWNDNAIFVCLLDPISSHMNFQGAVL